jgi:sugar O-acyltransferase (sialic acid O-acetyltransferase NeuD family)
MNSIVLVGYGGHAKSVADSIIRMGGYEIVGYTDLEDRGGDLRYLGRDQELEHLYNKGIRKAVLGLGYMGDSRTRDKIVALLKRIGFDMPVIVDPAAVIASDTIIGEGSFVGKNAVINAGSEIGRYTIINTGAIVEHDNRIGDHTHIAVGAVCCGDVRVGEHTLIGANATVIQGIEIGSDCIIGAGSTVLSPVADGSKVYGIVSSGTQEADLHG